MEREDEPDRPMRLHQVREKRLTSRIRIRADDYSKDPDEGGVHLVMR